MTRPQVLALCVGLALTLAYLSLIPFRFVPLSFESALGRFATLPYLSIGAQGRADWIANLCMYLPLGALLARLLQPEPGGRLEWPTLVAVFVVGSAWAALVEFAQLYFPDRTASLNDLLAEALGALAGAALWLRTGHRWQGWWQGVLHGGDRTARAALTGYAVLYLALNLAPYDFVVSGAELFEHLQSPMTGWWLAREACGPVPCSLRLLVEMLLMAPLGLWWAVQRPRSVGALQAALLGIALGLLLEGMQLLLVSGVSQGASVLSRATGFVLGTAVHARVPQVRALQLDRIGKRLCLVAVLPYLAVVGSINGLIGDEWVTVSDAAARLGEVRWLPFYYQYFTTEQNAIRSGVVHALLYAPVGVALWLWRYPRAIRPAWAAAIAAAIAALAEFGKLLVPPRHPDLTDILIAAASAWLVAALLRSMTQPAARSSAAETAEGDGSEQGTAQRRAPLAGFASAAGTLGGGAIQRATHVESAAAWKLLGVLMLLGAAVSLAHFPIARTPLAVALIAYAWAVARWPIAYLWVVPVALTVLDLAPYSGRFYWDELDILLLVTFGVRLIAGLPMSVRVSQWPHKTVFLLLAATAGSALVALIPVPALDANAFDNYLSPYNALRVGKGVIWGLLLAALIARDECAGVPVHRPFIQGCALALLGISALVAWERAAFTGLFDLAANFRVAGPVSAMHVGGAYLDAILLALFPLSLLLVLQGRSLAWRVVGLAVVALALYSIVVTFSRATLAAWVVAMIVFGVLWGRRARFVNDRTRTRGSGVRVAAFGVLAAVGFAAVALAASETLRARFSTVAEDAGVRQSHWRATIEMINTDLPGLVFGKGLGSFPREFYLQHSVDRAMAAYRLELDPQESKSGLVLHGGLGLFVTQRVVVPPGDEVRAAVVARSLRGAAPLHVSLCEATVLHSARCAGGVLRPGMSGSLQELTLRAPAMVQPLDWARPLVVSLHNPMSGASIRVDSVSLRDRHGVELIRNGDFARGTDNWFFTSDDHLAWHPKNAILQVTLEQGLIGVLAYLAMLIAVVRRMSLADARLARIPAIGAALAGLLLLALFDTVIDAPRVLTLLLLFAFFPIAGGRPLRLRRSVALG